jgi:hypothetical protein
MIAANGSSVAKYNTSHHCTPARAPSVSRFQCGHNDESSHAGMHVCTPVRKRARTCVLESVPVARTCVRTRFTHGNVLRVLICSSTMPSSPPAAGGICLVPRKRVSSGEVDLSERASQWRVAQTCQLRGAMTEQERECAAALGRQRATANTAMPTDSTQRTHCPGDAEFPQTTKPAPHATEHHTLLSTPSASSEAAAAAAVAEGGGAELYSKRTKRDEAPKNHSSQREQR